MAKLEELTVIAALFPLQVVLPATLKLVTSGIAFTVAATEAVPWHPWLSVTVKE